MNKLIQKLHWWQGPLRRLSCLPAAVIFVILGITTVPIWIITIMIWGSQPTYWWVNEVVDPISGFMEDTKFQS